MGRTVLKLIMLSICLVSCSNSNSANSEKNSKQITFCGVPLSGNIENFTKSLAAEGVKVNNTITSQLQDGARAYDVKNFEYPCLARVEYNTVTRNVYEATLMFNHISKLSDFDAFKDRFMQKIKEKYSKGIFTVKSELDDYKGASMFFNYYAVRYIIHNNQTNDYVGEIYMYWDAKDENLATQTGTFMLQIMYRNNEAPSFEEQSERYY